MIAYDIAWDTEGEDFVPPLPSEIELPEYITELYEISEYLSDCTGFCHKGFCLK